MSHPRYRMHRVWFVLFGIAVLVAGCGQDQTTSPLNQPPDTAPPDAPTGLVVTTQTDAKFRIEWRPCGEPNVVGYVVYRYEPDPSRVFAYVPINQTPIPTTRMTVTGTPGTTYYLRVAAVDITTKESTMSEPMSFTFQASESDTELGENGTDNVIWRGEEEWGSGHQEQQYRAGDMPLGK